MSKLKLLSVVIILFLVGTLTASAGSPHFIGTVSFSDGSFRMTASIAGLGNIPVTVRMDAYANITALCKNEEGYTTPGSNPISVTETTSAVSNHNGRSSFDLVVPDPLKASPPPPLPSAKAAGCADYHNWWVVGFVPDSTRWTGAKVSVFDNSTGALVIQQNYTCTGVGKSLACTPA